MAALWVVLAFKCYCDYMSKNKSAVQDPYTIVLNEPAQVLTNLLTLVKYFSFFHNGCHFLSHVSIPYTIVYQISLRGISKTLFQMIKRVVTYLSPVELSNCNQDQD